MSQDRPIERQDEVASGVGECRRCRSFCDKLIEPKDCISIGCEYVYCHRDDLTGQEYVGCMRRVFSGEVTLDSLRQPRGFGGIKVTGQTLPHCQFRVERAYEGEGPAYDCVNRRFFDCDDQSPEGIRAFDLRDALRPR